MNERRISGATRLKSSIVAEQEILRYKGDHAAWHKHIHNVELDPVQVLKCKQMDMNPSTLDMSCRRTGKTAVKALYNLEELATQPDQQLGIVAPRLAQSQVNLRYMTDAIARSEILKAFVAYDRGRRQLADTYFRFFNRSRATAYGIMANVDGDGMTIADLEEVDDMPKDRLFSRFLLMLGAARRLGADRQSRTDPRIRITGVFKGADTLTDLISSGNYHVLPIVDCYMGIELGILNEQFIMQMRDELAPDEYIRQLLCKNVSARNLIYEILVRRAIQTGIQAHIQMASPAPGAVYKGYGKLYLGYDCAGHGESPLASKHAAVVIEQIGNWTVPIYARTWRAGADDLEVIEGLVSMMRYFRPEKAVGDAFGIGIIRAVNEKCLKEGITDIDPRGVGDGESVASNWPHWHFSPLRFEGMTQHQMASAVRSIFSAGMVAMPYVDNLPHSDTEAADMHLLQQQIPNIKRVSVNKSYSSYQMANAKLGDDLWDAFMAAVWAFVGSIVEDSPSIILLGKKPRSQLLEAAHALPQ